MKLLGSGIEAQHRDPTGTTTIGNMDWGMRETEESRGKMSGSYIRNEACIQRGDMQGFVPLASFPHEAQRSGYA